MTSHVIWAFVASLWALVLWDMVRRWAFATATRGLKAEIEALHALIDVQRRDIEALGGSKLPARVKQLEHAYGVLKGHVETRLNPFAAKKTGT